MTDNLYVQARAYIARIESQAVLHIPMIKGGKVLWRKFGGGPPLVLIHGGHGSWMHWVRNIEALSRCHTLWVPDLPNSGGSDTLGSLAASDNKLVDIVEALVATFDALVPRDTFVDVAGFSFGGLLAGQFTARRGNVRRLALLGATGHGTPRRQSLDAVNWRAPPTLAGVREALAHNLAAIMLHDPVCIDVLAIEISHQSCEHSRFDSKRLSRQPVMLEALKAFGGPLLLVWGADDVTGIPEHVTALWRTARPDLQSHILPNAGHWIQYECADTVNTLLLAHFQ